MTPTREQVIEFCEAAGLPESFSAHPGVKQAIRNAYSAGRLKGLEEAAEKVKSVGPEGSLQIVTDGFVAAIDQLKEQK